MSEDRYDDLVKAKRSDRDQAQRQLADIQEAQRRVQQIYFHRRNALFKAITDRAASIEQKFPDLGQLFVNSFGDSLKMSKSKHPSGYVLMAFDIETFVLGGAFKFQDGDGAEFALDMVLPSSDGDMIELWADGKPWSDEEIVTFVFDEFMPHIA